MILAFFHKHVNGFLIMNDQNKANYLNIVSLPF